MITSRLLTQFIVLAEELHFGKAAKRLHMSQPPLSQAINRLEQLLNVELLTRTNRSVSLTDAGKTFLEEAQFLLMRQAQAISNTRHAATGIAGTISIGFVGSVSYGLLPEMLTKFHTLVPDVIFDLKEYTSIEQIHELQAKRIDVGIIRTPIFDAGDLTLKVIKKERMIAVLPITHPLAQRKSIRLATLSNEKFMMFPPNKVFSLYTKTLFACQAAGFSPRVSLESWQMPTMVSLVAAGVGIALLPEQIKNIPHPGVKYCSLTDQMDHLELDIALAWRSENTSRLVKRFVETM